MTGLKFLTPAQVQWIVEQLCKFPAEVINPRVLEATMLRLKSASHRSADCQRALIRLRKFVQETQHLSLLEAFSQMSSEDRAGEIPAKEVRAALSKMPIQFPVTEINLIMEALQTDGDPVSLNTWIRVLCSADLPAEEHRIPKKQVQATQRPILLTSATSDSRFTPLANTPRRPLTAPSLKSLSARPLLKQQGKDESICVSSTHWSESSSVRPAEDLPSLLGESPGTQLVEAGRLITNTAELDEGRRVHKEMRSLGTHAYSGPGRHHEVLGEIEEGGVVTVLEENGVWARVQCGVYEGWVPLCKLDEEVARRLYSRHDSRAKPLGVKETGALSQLYLRKEPCWSSQALTKLSARAASGVIGGNEEWVKVEVAGRRGWVPRQFTSLSARTEVAQDQSKSFWAPLPAEKPDLFADYDRLKKSFLTPPVLPQKTLDSLKTAVQQKMDSLAVQNQDLLRKKLERLEWRKRVIMQWMKLELSQAFQ